MEDGGWRMEDGGWRMEEGGWRMEEERKSPAEGAAIGRREIIMGLDGMSRVAEPGNDPFGGGHSAAAVMSSAFFCRNEKLEEDTQQEILSHLKARLLTRPIYAPL